MKFVKLLSIRWIRCASVLAVALAFLQPSQALAQGGVGPKPLFEPLSPNAAKQLSLKGGSEAQVSASMGSDGVSVSIKPGPESYPSVILKPVSGGAWDLSLYGHVEAKVSNTGNKRVNVSVRVDNEGAPGTQPWNSEGKWIEPGRSKTIRVYFGYSYGCQKGFKLDPAKVTQVLFFTGKTDSELSFKVESAMGAGWPGEKIGVDPDRIGVKPPNGILFEAGATPVSPDKQFLLKGGAKGSLASDGKALQIDFPSEAESSATFTPVDGVWNLNAQLQVKLKVRNSGQTAFVPSARLESDMGPSSQVSAKEPLAPGAETVIAIPFAASAPWKGIVDPEQEDVKRKGSWGPQLGTGTMFRSNIVSGVTLLSGGTPGAKSLQVLSIVADLPALELPDWLGKRPPVEGDWKLTFDENFDGESLDLTRWSVYAGNWWDKRNHFSKDEVIVKDGFLRLRTEKKTGFHNDDPAGAKSDYATGWAETYGKWTQRYGYFEIREKQPSAKCMWPGLWMMPDRGKDFSPKDSKRGSTGEGGMEFDITESQSAWGPHRFNIAMHWDNYKEGHKSIGTSANYVQADKDGFIVVGMLWTPGSLVFYGNGKEILRWESPRVSNVQAQLILQNLIGGWDNEELDDSQLPADFVIDYIRVWQRADLASPEDGPKPNAGGLKHP